MSHPKWFHIFFTRISNIATSSDWNIEKTALMSVMGKILSFYYPMSVVQANTETTICKLHLAECLLGVDTSNGVKFRAHNERDEQTGPLSLSLPLSLSVVWIFCLFSKSNQLKLLFIQKMHIERTVICSKHPIKIYRDDFPYERCQEKKLHSHMSKYHRGLIFWNRLTVETTSQINEILKFKRHNQNVPYFVW